MGGAAGLIVAPRGRLLRAALFTIAAGKITRAEIIAAPGRTRQLALAVLDL